MTNEDRAARAEVALNAYQAQPGVDPAAAVRDLMTDLMHLLNLGGHANPFYEASVAFSHFEAESEEPA